MTTNASRTTPAQTISKRLRFSASSSRRLFSTAKKRRGGPSPFASVSSEGTYLKQPQGALPGGLFPHFPVGPGKIFPQTERGRFGLGRRDPGLHAAPRPQKQKHGQQKQRKKDVAKNLFHLRYPPIPDRIPFPFWPVPSLPSSSARHRSGGLPRSPRPAPLRRPPPRRPRSVPRGPAAVRAA